MEAIRVWTVGVRDAAEVGELLAASHADYPALRHAFPNPAVRARVLRTFLTATARDAARQGGALLARDEVGLLGVALLMPPGTFPLPAARKVRMGPELLRTALAAPREFPGFVRVGARLERSVRAGSGWYLQAMGVHPRAQRRGVGGRLLAPVLAAADRAGMACHLHTSDPANVDYYSRHGFSVDEPAVQVFPAGPHYIGMVRPGRDRD